MTRRASVVFAALALAATACGTRVQEWPEGTLEPSDYYRDRAATTDTPENSESPTEDAAAPDSPASGTADDQTRRGSSSSATGDGALPAPAPGTYTYDQSGDDAESTSSTITWAVERTASAVIMTSSETEDDGEFSVTTKSRYRVTNGAFELLSTTSEFNGQDPETCTYQPPILLLKLPLKIGDKWRVRSACEDEPTDQVEVSIARTANDVIGGKNVKTFVVTMKQSFDSTDDTTGERTSFSFEDTRHIDPATLLTVIEDITFSVDGDKSTVHRQLRSLTPR